MMSRGGQSWSQRGRRSLVEVSPRADRVHVEAAANICLHRMARSWPQGQPSSSRARAWATGRWGRWCSSPPPSPPSILGTFVRQTITYKRTYKYDILSTPAKTIGTNTHIDYTPLLSQSLLYFGPKISGKHWHLIGIIEYLISARASESQKPGIRSIFFRDILILSKYCINWKSTRFSLCRCQM